MPLELPPPAEAALLLDLDGTLLDLAPTPDSVVVPPGLLDTLRRLRAHLGDALAVVTGRPVEQIDALLADTPYAVAGEHGGAIRHQPGGPIVRPTLPDPPVEWIIHAAEIIERHPGSLLEQKQRGFVFHYRQAPEHGPALRQAALALIAPERDRFQVLEAAMAWEVRPRGVDKGIAVNALAAESPFAGRLPVFIGDDVTDEDGMRAARALGGAGLRVDDAFGSPEQVRTWLRQSADALDRGETGWARNAALHGA
ncbi:MAG TPA: trehalose-phosphatase [Acetobacteraceae bacterium]|nr:trehalose-phosphatase [Acetobacteraceae bacterium]